MKKPPRPRLPVLTPEHLRDFQAAHPQFAARFDFSALAQELEKATAGRRQMYSMRLRRSLVLQLDHVAHQLQWSRTHLVEVILGQAIEKFRRAPQVPSEPLVGSQKPARVMRRMGEGRRK